MTLILLKPYPNVVGMSRMGELHYQLIKYSSLNDTRHCYGNCQNSSIPIKQRKIAIQRGERIRIIITSITWSYSSGDIQTYKGKMTTKMILIPIDRLKALEKISTDTPAKMPADVEFKLLQQNKNLHPRVREPEQKKEISMDSTMHHMQEPQRARIKRTFRTTWLNTTET